jgi:hypothetical protein
MHVFGLCKQCRGKLDLSNLPFPLLERFPFDYTQSNDMYGQMGNALEGAPLSLGTGSRPYYIWSDLKSYNQSDQPISPS